MTSQTEAATSSRAEASSRYLRLLPILAAAVAIVHGFRRPLPWAATQAQFTCDLIPKRCAFGQALARAHFPAGRYEAFAALATTLSISALLVYAVVAWRAGLLRSVVGVMLLAALAGSFGTTVLAAMNGYLDLPLALIAALCILPSAPMQKFAVWVAAIAGIAIHEGYLIIFLPVTLLPLLLRVRRPRDIIMPAMILLSALALTILLALNKPLQPSQADQAMRILQARVDFDVDPAAVLVTARSMSDNLHMMGQLIHTGWWRGQLLAGVAIFLPPGAMFTWAVLGALRAPWTAKALTLLAGVSPLAMNLIGFDTWRWSALCVVTMFLAVAAAVKQFGPLRLSAAPLFVGVALMLCPLCLLFPRPLAQNPNLSPDIIRIISSTG
jgi:hypothetical protein